MFHMLTHQMLEVNSFHWLFAYLLREICFKEGATVYCCCSESIFNFFLDLSSQQLNSLDQLLRSVYFPSNINKTHLICRQVSLSSRVLLRSLAGIIRRERGLVLFLRYKQGFLWKRRLDGARKSLTPVLDWTTFHFDAHLPWHCF